MGSQRIRPNWATFTSLPCCSPPGHPPQYKPLALSACVFPRTSHFQVLDKSPLSVPGSSPPSCSSMNQWSSDFLFLCQLKEFFLKLHLWGFQQETNNTLKLRQLRKKVKLLSCVWLFASPWTNVAHQAPPSMGYSRQEYWSRLPFPSPGDHPDPGIEPRSPALQADALTSGPPGKPKQVIYTTELCQGPASAESRGYPQDGRRRREREKTRETSLDRAKSVFYFLTTGFYTLSQNVFKVQDAYSWLHRIHITSFWFLGKAGFFLLSNSIAILSTLSSGLGAINILCRSGDCKPIFCFHGDLNWKVTVS